MKQTGQSRSRPNAHETTLPRDYSSGTTKNTAVQLDWYTNPSVT